MRRLLILLLLLASVPAIGRDFGQWNNVDPKIREWFRNQKQPGTGLSCCNESDGTYAEEDIRDGHYWARWTIAGQQIEWTQIPDEVVIRDPNRNGAPVVWSVPLWDQHGKIGGVKIYCFAPGGGV